MAKANHVYVFLYCTRVKLSNAKKIPVIGKIGNNNLETMGGLLFVISIKLICAKETNAQTKEAIPNRVSLNFGFLFLLSRFFTNPIIAPPQGELIGCYCPLSFLKFPLLVQ